MRCRVTVRHSRARAALRLFGIALLSVAATACSGVADVSGSDWNAPSSDPPAPSIATPSGGAVDSGQQAQRTAHDLDPLYRDMETRFTTANAHAAKSMIFHLREDVAAMHAAADRAHAVIARYSVDGAVRQQYLAKIDALVAGADGLVAGLEEESSDALDVQAYWDSERVVLASACRDGVRAGVDCDAFRSIEATTDAQIEAMDEADLRAFEVRVSAIAGD